MSSSTQHFTGDDVYLGVWTNWSHGRIRGATLTLNRRNGGLLTAFLALLVGAAGTSFWKIGCFFIHRYFSSKDAADALYHQRQAILRNSANSQSGFVTLLNTCWAWRRTNIASFWRFLPAIFFAVITFIGFTIAGIFSSAIATSMGQEVLLKSFNCGSLNFNVDDLEQWTLWNPYVAKSVSSSLSYARRCYRKDVNPRDCAIFIQPRLQWKADHNATCPFPNKDICLSDSGNLRLDSGYINSDHHLGINSSPEKRFLIRTVVDCAPLQTKGYTKNDTVVTAYQRSGFGNADDGQRSTTYTITEYFYGAGATNSSLSNATYRYSAKRPNVDSYYRTDQTGVFDYFLSAWAAYPDVDGTVKKVASDFTPIPALWDGETDVFLFFLSANDVEFLEACDDPWYAATTIVKEPALTGVWGNTTITCYIQDEPAGVLGCASRHQFCNADSDTSCTSLVGYDSAVAAANALWQTDEQRNFFDALLNRVLSSVSGVQIIVSVAGIASLTARDSLSNGVQGLLPNNQWQLEVENWYDATLADLQRLTVEYATGPTESALLRILERPQTESERQLCHSVKIRSDAVTSYSVLGLSILIGSCGLLIIISVTIESFTGWLDKKSGKDNYQQLEWMSNDILQLQRFAHEELGCGTWIGENIPITAVGETLAVLDISEPSHPRLVNPASAQASVVMMNTSSLVMADASSPLSDTSSPIANASSSIADASSPTTNASSSTADASSPIADISSFMGNASEPLMDVSLFLADPSSPLADSSSLMVDASLSMMEEASSSAAEFMEVTSSSQEGSNAPILDTRR